MNPSVKIFKAIFFSCVIVLVFNSCNHKKDNIENNTGFAGFDWFEYKGSDPVYKIDPDTNSYYNPILAGFYPDPSIVSVGDDFYLVNSSFSFFPGIPIFKSKDLVNWEQIGHVLDRPSQLKLDSLGVSRGVFAPAINYHDSVFYVINTVVNGIGNFYVTAKDPMGPWSEPVLLDFEGIDPSFFFDDNGKTYILNNGAPAVNPLYDGHRAIWIQEYDLEKKQQIGPRKVIINGGVELSKKPIWIEGPHMYKINGVYYLMAAEGGTAEGHSEVIFRGNSPFGPFVPFKDNPILTQRDLDTNRLNPVTCTGHADLVQTKDGEWFAVFLGCRPYESNFYNTGRETFMLPVKWTDGWPVILPAGQTVPFAVAKPNLPKQTKPKVPLNANFTYRDDFNDSTLGLQYYFLRTPHEKWYEIKDGRLLIFPRNQSVDSVSSQPSFIARRQQHAFCNVTTSINYSPVNVGDKAGLIVFQNEAAYYFVGMVKDSMGVSVQLEQGSQTGSKVITKVPLSLDNNNLYLKIEARGKYYDFFYSTIPEGWSLLKENVDATLLSTAKAGGFVGACFGMYAYSVK